ncbi:MAG TPA: DUF1573 domain-containing protein [Spirochaetia bacterium]|nr:DUF1573 domain-containing protein [Spirochaetia bacterium]
MNLQKRILKITVLCGLCFILFAAASSCGPDEQYQGPHIIFDSREFDLGPVPQHSEFKFSFRYRNSGTEPLEILSLISSCGCTVLDKSPPPVSPGERASIDGTFFSQTYRNKVVRTVTIRTNDPNNATVVLTINAFVQPTATSD